MRRIFAIGFIIGGAIGASFIKWFWDLSVPGVILGISIADWWTGVNGQYGEYGSGVPQGLVMTLNAMIYGTIAGSIAVSLVWASRRRERTDRCSNCSYNLTGNASGVCPECGTKIESP